MDNGAYLSSQRFVSWMDSETETHRIRGSSINVWTEYADTSQSGSGHAPSVYCRFWQTTAAEWKDRALQCGWHSMHDREYIEQFGCHLVPVGHPRSARKSLEWNFSIVEEILLWSLSYTQLQCYAIMKLILKDLVEKNVLKHIKTYCALIS